jgi:epoxide hydrolase
MSAEIEPYRISVGDDVLDDLELRLRNTRWPDAELLISGQCGRGSTSCN